MTEKLSYQLATLKPDHTSYSIERLYFPTETVEETEDWESVARDIIQVMTKDRGKSIKSPYIDIANNLTVLTVVESE
jgi:hypothetical protein